MGRIRAVPAIGAIAYLFAMTAAAMYFAFASVEGDYGLFRRLQVEAEQDELRAEERRLAALVAELENKTRRLSDDFLDLELLDQQARDVLGLVRPDEVVLR